MIENLNPALEFKAIDSKELSLFTEEFKTCIANAINPKIFIVLGRTREGKSTLLNHLLFD